MRARWWSGFHRFGLWRPDRALTVRLVRIAAAVLVMSLGLVAAMRLIPQDGALSLAALCLGGLALYALGAFATGAVSRDDWASLTKNA